MKQGDRTLGVALWGDNGHQIHNLLPQYPRLRLLAFGAFGAGNTDAIRAAIVH